MQVTEFLCPEKGASGLYFSCLPSGVFFYYKDMPVHQGEIYVFLINPLPVTISEFFYLHGRKALSWHPVEPDLHAGGGGFRPYFLGGFEVRHLPPWTLYGVPLQCSSLKGETCAPRGRV